MAEIIRFDFNAPHDLTLKFDEGKETASAYGEQLMYSTDDGRIFYLDVNSQAVSELHRLQIRKGVPFRITKTGRARQVNWLVQRLDSLEQQLTESVAVSRNANAQRPVLTTERSATHVVAMPSSTHNTPSKNTSGMTLASQILAGCLIAAIDAANAAEQYSAAKGGRYEFAPDDVRSMGISLYIQHAKALEAQYRDQAANEGGAKWQQ